MALLLLPLLAYVAAQDGIKKQQQNNGGQSFTGSVNNAEIRRAVNGTEFMLECPRAAYLVRTHMAPDFEHPQLVRRLDWLHDGALVASYQQELLSTDINQQWWVSGNRYTLRRPFFELRIAPLLAHDAGQWQCQLDTDPLFEAELPKLVAIDLLVLVRPPVPPKPTVIRHTDRSATLQWDKYASSAAHQPIIRFSILVAKIEDSSLRVVSTPDNRTSIKIEGLWPNTRYAFSIRAENAIGESAFGPEVLFRTIGQPPRTAPKITSLKNGTTPDCVELDWDYPELDKELTPIVGFRIMIHRVGTGAVREWYVKGNNARSQTLCTLEAYADYVLTMEADNGFGYSPGETMPFRTDESVPNDPPQLIQIRPVVRGEALYLTWREPSQPCGIITDYVIYFKDVPSKREMSRLSLSVAPNEPSKAFAYNLTKLLPNNRYKIQLAAATKKGEGIRSDALLADTDYAVPREALTVTNLSYSCDSSQLAFHWSALPSSMPAGATAYFRVHLISSLGHSRIFNVTAASLDKKNTTHKLLIDKVQQNERISLTILASVQSRADPTVWLDGPISTQAHFVLLAAGWKCRFRSSACPPANWLSKTIICEHFATTNSANTQQFAGHPHQADQQRGDANGHFIFLIFGAAITFAISVLFTCILRRRCFLFKAFLRHNKKHHQKRGPSVSEKSHQKHRGAESTSLVQRGTRDAQLQGESVVLPPITLLPNGGTAADGICTMPTSNGTNGMHLATTCACPTVDDQNEENLNEAADDEAENVLPTVSVLHFDAYFEEMCANANAGFKRQFKELELDTIAMLEREQASSSDGELSAGRASRCSATMAMSNNEGEKLKNRYVDVNALPRKSRIQLVDPRTGYLQHYINANYVDSCDEKRAYIATQAPLPHTFADFWAMVWQERSSVLVALTNIVESGLKKCDQYWPNCVGDFVQADDFRITLSGQRTNSVFTHRVLQLTKTSSSLSSGNGDDDHGRRVHQLHFMAWPDHGVPDSPFPLLHFINYVAELHQCSTTAITAMPSSSTSTSKNSATTNGIGTICSTAAGTASSGPCVVHCSAGVGRSGAFILIDSLRRHLLRCDRIDVIGQLRRMRRQRAQLVQTLDQFIFCHEVLRHLVANGITRQPRTHFANYVRFLLSQRTPAGQRRIRAQFTDLLRCPHQPQRCGPPSMPQCVPLPGYHRTDEFLLLLGFSCGTAMVEERAEQHKKQQMMWQRLWHSSCQAVVLLDSCPDGQTHLALPSQFEETDDQNGVIRTIDLVRMDNTNVQLRRDDGKELFIGLHRISSTALLHNPWLQIERLQCELQQQHRAQLAVLELGTTAPSAVPFLFCVFQSVACQLEQEGAVDVLLWLALCRHSVCGCWTEQSEVELIYRRVLELIELQKIIN